MSGTPTDTCTYLQVAVGGANGEHGAVDGGVLRDGGGVGRGDELRGELVSRHQHSDVSSGGSGGPAAVHRQHLELWRKSTDYVQVQGQSSSPPPPPNLPHQDLLTSRTRVQ